MKTELDRREFVKRTTVGVLGLSGVLTACDNSSSAQARTHPYLHIRNTVGNKLRTVADVSQSIESGHSKTLWSSILKTAEGEIGSPSLLASSMVQDRSATQARLENLDFIICEAAGKRITRNALAYLLTGREDFKRTAWNQLQTILDPDRWPDWIDQAHLRFGHPAGLRTGMLAHDAALGFDWLFQGLDDTERRFVVDGLLRRAVEPFLRSLEQDPWWMHDLNNWATTICGGLGVCGMALDGHDDSSAELIRIATDTMLAYLQLYGSEGEFSESPAYANATLRPVEYFQALLYWSGGREGQIAGWPFVDTCYWLKYLTLPPGRVAAFGDSRAYAKPWTKHVAAIASASRDGILQQFYLDYNSGAAGDPLELLWYDDSLAGENSDSIPLGRVYPAYGGCVSNRTSWDPNETECIVYGKASREDNHEHHDAGSLCIDAYGERLVIDPGSPSSYPPDFFEDERWNYYNAGIVGHNVLMIEQNEMRLPDWQRGDGPKQNLHEITGRFVNSDFSPAGGWWQMDLTNAYHDVVAIKRTVVHLFPGYIAVLDTAQLPTASDISLRWHTINEAEPDDDHAFVVLGRKGQLSAQVIPLEGEIRSRRKEHSYQSPFDKDRAGELLEQRNESYVEVLTRAESFTALTVFALSKIAEPPGSWERSSTKSAISHGSVECTWTEDSLTLRNVESEQTVRATLA